MWRHLNSKTKSGLKKCANNRLYYEAWHYGDVWKNVPKITRAQASDSSSGQIVTSFAAWTLGWGPWVPVQCGEHWTWTLAWRNLFCYNTRHFQFYIAGPAPHTLTQERIGCTIALNRLTEHYKMYHQKSGPLKGQCDENGMDESWYSCLRVPNLIG